ncbi:MAG: biotin/lipoyl-containing protein [Tepidiformaceae bacterium]
MGDTVEVGAVLVLLEAMKMEHRIVAPTAGTVKTVNVRERDVVADGEVLVELG